MSDASSAVTYTSPVAPPSPDYIPGPKHPPSPDYVPGPKHPPLPMEIPCVPEQEYPEYLAPSDDEAPLEDQPLPTDASPIAASLDYVADSDPKEDPEDNQANYPADGGDGDDEPFDDDDDTNDEDAKEEPFEEDDKEEEEEHPGPTDSLTVLVVDLVLSARETEALEADEPTHSPGSPITGAARQPGPTESDLRRCRVEPARYRTTDAWDEIVDKMMEMAPTTLEWVKERVTKLDTTVRQRMDEFEAFSMDRISAIAVYVGTLERQNVMRTGAEMSMSFQGTAGVVGLTRWLGKMESVFQISNCTVACQDVAYVIPWAALKRMITNKYCPRGEIQKVERYIGSLPDMIHGSVKASNPQWMPEAIKFATELMHKKMLTHAERQAEHKRKFDDTSRNTQHQQPLFKRNNVARAYTTWQGDKKPYGGTKPLCPKCNYHHDGPCVPKCTNFKECRAGRRNAVARAYLVGTVGTNPNSNVATVMYSSPHSTIVLSASDIENTFSSTNILNYFSASPGSISPDSSNDFTKYLLDILVFFPLHDDSKMEVIQAYDTIPPPQVVIALPVILPPSLVLSVSPMFDSQDLFPSKEISCKDTETHVESPILAPPSSSEGSSSPVSISPSYISFHIFLLDHQRVTITLSFKVVDPTLGNNSLGMFASESLAWKKWPNFPHNRYVEEAKSYAQPGSVTEKKAFFEAYFNKLVAQKLTAVLLEQQKANTAATCHKSDVEERVYGTDHAT
nr:hypothetical protein [Tanacetum cinerariifolium]